MAGSSGEASDSTSLNRGQEAWGQHEFVTFVVALAVFSIMQAPSASSCNIETDRVSCTHVVSQALLSSVTTQEQTYNEWF